MSEFFSVKLRIKISFFMLCINAKQIMRVITMFFHNMVSVQTGP